MTSTDLQAYQGIITRLRGMLDLSEFEQTFASVTNGLPKSKQFLLRMELRRLAQPCNYYIDLRGHVDGDVKPYEYRGKTHYLDDQARQIFEQGLEAYGKYTVGVYEEVMNADNNYRVRHRKETDEHIRHTLQNLRKGPQLPEPSPAESFTTPEDNAAPSAHRFIRFGHYISRAEERMNFSIEVEIKHPDGNSNAMTTDLSVSGCRLKVPFGKTAMAGDVVRLALTGLEREYALDLVDTLQYQILEIKEQDKHAYWRLKRLEPERNPAFNQFLHSFIQGNKRRYKLNLDNILDGALTKGYEQYYLPRLQGLPVFLTVAEGSLASRFALTSDYSRSIWHYFIDEQQQSVLGQVLNARRLKQLLNNSERNATLYCFTHAAKGKLYFYTALASELAASSELRQMFWGFGAGKPSWRVFQLSLMSVAAEEATSKFALPGEHGLVQPSPLVASMLRDVRYMITLADISNASQRHYYAAYRFDSTKLAALNQFGLSKAGKVVTCEAIPVHYVNLRSESRYLYKTQVLLRTRVDDTPIPAYSRDFSAGGLQLETEIAVDFKKGDVLLVDLPDLQKITSKYQLSALPYEVMAVSKNRTIINLKAAKTESHLGRQFFSQLIQSNRSKLTVAQETPKYPGLSEALRNMYLQSCKSLVLYVHRYGLRHDIAVVGCGNKGNQLQALLQLPQQQPASAPLSVLTKHPLLELKLAEKLKQMKRQDPPFHYELYLTVQQNDDGSLQLSSDFDFEFNSAAELKQHLVDALSTHTLLGFRCSLIRAGKMDPEYLARELNYISIYAIHKARVLEEELWHVEGVIEGFDISSELVNRLQPEAAQQQELQRQFILQSLTERASLPTL
ncbi:PilZ domain-containing protein [Alishewanella aestuarii]|nr:PilZ domain-containing protein [Alishewanella aestuarii]